MISREHLFDLKNGTMVCCDKNSKYHFSDERLEDFALVMGNFQEIRIVDVLWLKSNKRQQVHYDIFEQFKVIQNV